MRLLYFWWLLPRNFLILLLNIYRQRISPLYGDVCRYYPSCSLYGLKSLQSSGMLLGAVLTLWRIIRCNPWSKGGFDEPRAISSRYFLSKHGFVKLSPRIVGKQGGVVSSTSKP